MNGGIFDILPYILQWTSTHEATVAVFLLQRLTLHETGIHILITPDKTLHKPPIYLLGDFIQQHISAESLDLPADTLAGILYLYTKAVEVIGCATTDEFTTQWNDILGIVVDAEDSFVRLWAVLALASCPLHSVKEETAIRVLALTDESEVIRSAAAYAIWCWQGSTIASHHRISMDVELQLVAFIGRIAEDASFNVRTLALSLAMELARIRREQIVEHLTEHSTRCSNEEKGPSPAASVYHHLISILANALNDPLLFLREAVAEFLEQLRLQQNTCNYEEWLRVFPYGPSDGQQKDQNSLERPNSDALSLAKVSSQLMMSGRKTVF